VVRVEVGKRVVVILPCLHAGQGVSKKLLMSVVVTFVLRTNVPLAVCGQRIPFACDSG
jgi:hypothetical protein